MKKSIFLTTTIATILAAGPLMAAEAEVKVKANESPKVEAEVKRDDTRREYKQEVRVENAVRPNNRAQKLIGMEVRNRNDEKLGEIKDIVLDLPSGKISYVALSVGGFLGVGEKLIAVPTSALIPSERNGDILIMDATRGEIVDAPGFAQTNWPDHRNPNFDQSPFWRPHSRGTAATSETGKAKLYTDADHKELKVESSVNGDNRAHTTMGRIKTMGSQSVIVENNGRTETYSLRNDNKIRTSDYKNGDRVTIKYHSENGKMIIDDLTRN